MTELTRLIRNRSKRAEQIKTNRSSSLTAGLDPNIRLERELEDTEYAEVGFNKGLMALFVVVLG